MEIRDSLSYWPGHLSIPATASELLNSDRADSSFLSFTHSTLVGRERWRRKNYAFRFSSAHLDLRYLVVHFFDLGIRSNRRRFGRATADKQYVYELDYPGAHVTVFR